MWQRYRTGQRWAGGFVLWMKYAFTLHPCRGESSAIESRRVGYLASSLLKGLKLAGQEAARKPGEQGWRTGIVVRFFEMAGVFRIVYMCYNMNCNT